MGSYKWLIDGREQYQVGPDGKPTGWRRFLAGQGQEFKINTHTGRRTGRTRARTSSLSARQLAFETHR